MARRGAALLCGALLCAALLAGVARAQEQCQVGAVSLPTKTWGLALDLTGFSIEIDEMKADGRRYLMAANKESGVRCR